MAGRCAPALRASISHRPPTPPCRWPATADARRAQGIHDNIYVRAIVLDDGTTQAALVAWEALFVPDAVWEETSKRIAAETGIRPENLLLSAVHNHGAPTLGLAETAPKTAAYTRSVEDAAVAAVRRREVAIATGALRHWDVDRVRQRQSTRIHAGRGCGWGSTRMDRRTRP